MEMTLRFDGVNKEDNIAWKLKRIEKKIKLTDKRLLEWVGCSYNLLSMHENEKAVMAEDKIERYKQFITAYPDIDDLMNKIR
jgi:hypothetical protein